MNQEIEKYIPKQEIEKLEQCKKESLAIFNAFELFKVENDITYEKLSLKLKEASNLADIFEEQVKVTLQPLRDVISFFNDEKKIIITKIEEGITIGKDKMKVYLDSKNAEIEKKKEKVKEQHQEILGSKELYANNTIKLEQQVYSRLFGGTYVTLSAGTEKTDIGCQSAEDCLKVIDILTNHYPDVSAYEEFRVFAMDIKDKYLDIAQKVKTFFHSNKTEEVEKLRVEVKRLKEDREQVILKMIANVEKKLNKGLEAIKTDLPGQYRTSMDYEVVSRHEVPVEYLCVDKDKIKKFMQSHKDEMKERLKENPECKQPIPGIKFILKKTFANA